MYPSDLDHEVEKIRKEKNREIGESQMQAALDRLKVSVPTRDNCILSQEEKSECFDLIVKHHICLWAPLGNGLTE